MYYVSILKNSNGKLEIGYTEINPEVNLKISKEGKKIVYYEAYHNEKEAMHRRDSLKLYGKAWAQLKRRVEKSLK